MSQLLGAKKKNLVGFSIATSQFRVGYLEQTEIFQTTLISNSLLEQMNVTKDKSDYLWYTLRLVIHKYIHLSDIRVQIYLTFLFIYSITFKRQPTSGAWPNNWGLQEELSRIYSLTK